MRIYSSCKDMVYEVEREIFEMGLEFQSFSYQDQIVKKNENFKNKELIGYSYTLSNWKDKLDIFSYLSNNKIEILNIKNYAIDESKERLSKIPIKNPGKSWLKRSDFWREFLHYGKFSYTYHERIFPQLLGLIEELKKVGSRQIVLPIYDSSDRLFWGGKRRIPCSMYYQFLNRIENGIPTLSLLYTMRSCDFYTHFPVDVFIALDILEKIGEEIGSKSKRFIHFLGSLHAFKKDWNKRRIF